MSANRAHKGQKVRAREQKCVPRSTGMGIKKGLPIHDLEAMSVSVYFWEIMGVRKG